MAPFLEECDDGNNIQGDGCSPFCTVETLWTCIPSFTVLMGPSICTFSCKNGKNPLFVIAKKYGKDCDDGDNLNENGCTNLCNVDTGWTCSGGTAALPDTCKETCGDGYDYNTLPCEDGNLLSDDGCSSTC